ncbi:hypothetical protein ACOI1H_14735 [Loktanella sp. DJP18]|uniref:hypothetical protein n=1 Tax=Loktanella sp. DJP18 TaxID=3409788 RepID=UPI003BB80C4F
MTIHPKLSLDRLTVRPMATLREEDGFVLIVTRTGLIDAPYGAYVARYDGETWRDYRDNGIRGVYAEILMGWMPLPFSATDVDQALRLQDELNADPEMQMPVLEGDAADHLARARIAVFAAGPATKARAIMASLYRQLGDDVNGPRLPASAPAALVRLRAEITHWVLERATDAGALLAVIACLGDQARRQSHDHPSV